MSKKINNCSGKPMTIATADLETALLDAHYQGDPAARFAWLGWCEDNGVRLTEAGITGVWRGTLADWLSVGPSLVQRFALERVEFSDREPSGTCWWAYSVPLQNMTDPVLEIRMREVMRLKDTLPSEFFGEFGVWKEYPTRQEAIDDASRRAIRWARGHGQREEVRR